MTSMQARWVTVVVVWVMGMATTCHGRGVDDRLAAEVSDSSRKLEIGGTISNFNISDISRDMAPTTTSHAWEEEEDRGLTKRTLKCAFYKGKAEKIPKKYIGNVLRLIMPAANVKDSQISNNPKDDEHWWWDLVCAQSMLLEAIEAHCKMGKVDAVWKYMVSEVYGIPLDGIDVIGLFSDAVGMADKVLDTIQLIQKLTESCKRSEIEGKWVKQLQSNEKVEMYTSVAASVGYLYARPWDFKIRGHFGGLSRNWCGCEDQKLPGFAKRDDPSPQNPGGHSKKPRKLWA